VVYDITKLKVNFRVPEPLYESIQSATYCFEALGGNELGRDSYTLPARAEGTISANDEVVSDF
jgi:hypothetical protein